ncbi:MAG: MFS transporter, partial [Candidatus Limnocylindrales bacterium]
MSAAAAPAPSMFAVFRRRDFSLLWLAQLISTAGSSLTDLAAGIYVYRVTGSALAVGLTLMVTAIPSLVVGLLAGVFVDRHDRKRILMGTCLIQAVFVGLIAVVIGIDAIAVPGLYILLLLSAGVRQFFDPAHDSLIPEMASDEELASANSFLSIAAFGSTAIGFAGAGLLASVDLRLAFIFDALSFLVCAGLISLMGRYPMPKPDDEANLSVIVANLKSGVGTLFGTPILRSLFVVGAFMFFSFGLWNVLLLPMSIRELHATEFEYGLQEALTSVGFVAGSFFMARFSSKLPEPIWVVVGLVGMGTAGIFYALATSIPVAILLVMVSGFFNSPSSVARSVLLQRNTPREMRGRVFSAFYVMRDIIFLFGMAGAGLADILDIRLLLIVSGTLLFVSAAFTLVAPGLGITSLRAARARLEGAEGAPALAGAPFRPATLADFDRLAVRLGTFARLTPEQRA